MSNPIVTSEDFMFTIKSILAECGAEKKALIVETMPYSEHMIFYVEHEGVRTAYHRLKSAVKAYNRLHNI
jgi:hypothetical protein